MTTKVHDVQVNGEELQDNVYFLYGRILSVIEDIRELGYHDKENYCQYPARYYALFLKDCEHKKSYTHQKTSIMKYSAKIAQIGDVAELEKNANTPTSMENRGSIRLGYYYENEKRFSKKTPVSDE